MDQIPNMFGKTPNGTEPDKLAVFAEYVPFSKLQFYRRKLLWPSMRSEQEFVTDCLDNEEFIRLLNSGGADYESEDED